jgi:hypothetical protein
MSEFKSGELLAVDDEGYEVEIAWFTNLTIHALPEEAGE